MFACALQMVQAGGRAIRPILDTLGADGIANVLGLGWLGAYLTLSGSPIAAIALSLYGSGVVSDVEALAMLSGSRFGASLVVLFVGFLYWVRGKRDPTAYTKSGVYVGVVALLTAFALWSVALPLGVFVLRAGWLDGARFASPQLVSVFGATIDPLVARADEALPSGVVFLVGVVMLLMSFSVFDRVLPDLSDPSQKVSGISSRLDGRYPMFVFGSLITLMTLSVSISLSILVPLTLKGYVKKESIIPYVMGANVATWIDTLVASLLIDSPRAFTIVLVQIVCGGAVSLLVLIFGYGPFRRVIIRGAEITTASRRPFVAFAAFALVVPAALLLV